jgi:hypothetical protein
MGCSSSKNKIKDVNHLQSRYTIYDSKDKFLNDNDKMNKMIVNIFKEKKRNEEINNNSIDLESSIFSSDEKLSSLSSQDKSEDLSLKSLSSWNSILVQRHKSLKVKSSKQFLSLISLIEDMEHWTDSFILEILERGYISPKLLNMNTYINIKSYEIRIEKKLNLYSHIDVETYLIANKRYNDCTLKLKTFLNKIFEGEFNSPKVEISADTYSSFKSYINT